VKPLRVKYRLPPTTEQEEERKIDRLFESLGGIVCKLDQGYRKDPGGTRQTPGIPDRWVFFPRRSLSCWFEVKSPKGYRDHRALLANLQPKFKSSSARWKKWLHAQRQHRFGEDCTRCNVFHGLGTHEHALTLMKRMGILR
jgi:hypothetical protein